MSDFGFVNLRGDANSTAFLTAASSALGQDLPVAANTMSIDRHHVYWLGPDEWLIVRPDGDASNILPALRETLSGQHAAVTNVSGGNIRLQLAGENARQVLAKGCTLDFHPEAFPLGHCAQSGLAKAAVLIGHIDSQPAYEIIVRRSFADYLTLWLKSAS